MRCVSPVTEVRTKLQGDDKAFIILAEKAVQVLYEAEFWPIQLVGLQHILQRLRLYATPNSRQQESRNLMVYCTGVRRLICSLTLGGKMLTSSAASLCAHEGSC